LRRIVSNGLNPKHITDIKHVEVKTGNAKLSEGQMQTKNSHITGAVLPILEKALRFLDRLFQEYL